MTCAVVTTNDQTTGDQGRSYWFPATETATLGAVNGGTYDIYSETSKLVDSKLGGLDRWQVLNVSGTQF